MHCTVNGNQQELRDDIARKISEIKKPEIIEHNSCEYTILILKDYIGADWPGAKAYVKMVSHKRKDQKDYNPEPQYFVSSVTNKELIIEAIDNRWSIEDELHLFKDDFLRENACTFTNKNAIKAMARTRIRYKDNPMEIIELLLPLLNKKNVSRMILENMRGRVSK